ncbi:MAG TPA: peptide chain release factor N(5)-glutamine methyltransferase [Symbiobacteriaceae bacterium]|nr:peptide chain release factor N(5)-glutamine methyltransferase [Symbiobacteriaceae bacterium]
MGTVRQALADTSRRLAQAGVADAEREAAWLLAHVMGTSAGALRLRQEAAISPEAYQHLGQLADRRANWEPIQYILGTEEFMGMTFKVTPAVLIPRTDTEVLVRQTANRLHGEVHIADIGTGSGAVAVSLAVLLPKASIVAIDICPDALAVARENAAVNGVAQRIDFRQGDLLAPCRGESFDAIVSNPPYIGEAEWDQLMPEVRLYEPRTALTPPGDALLFYRRLAAEGPPLLKVNGVLAAEVGYTQAASVRALFEQAGLGVSVWPDSAGMERVVLGIGS